MTEEFVKDNQNLNAACQKQIIMSTGSKVQIKSKLFKNVLHSEIFIVGSKAEQSSQPKLLRNFKVAILQKSLINSCQI